MFEERHFPYEDECAECGAAEIVSHEDVQGVPSYLGTAGVAQAVEYVMERQRGWSLESAGGPVCPDCIGSLTSD